MSMKWNTLLTLILCAALLTACAGNAEDSDAGTNENAPTVETPSHQEKPEEPAPPESGGQALSADVLEEYADWFGQKDHNGLLRFPYTDGTEGAQIAPYLELLFYDAGETEISEEEYVLLEKAGMFLELDEFRLTRTYVVDSLARTLDMSEESAEAILEEDLFGVYLPETDAWYMCHGDTAWMSYSFDRGEYFPENETVKLYYRNPFLTVVQADGEAEFFTDQPMVVTLSIEGGEWHVLSNEMVS